MANEKDLVWFQFKDKKPTRGTSFLFYFSGETEEDFCLARSDEALPAGRVRLSVFGGDRIVSPGPLDHWALWPVRQEKKQNGSP